MPPLVLMIGTADADLMSFAENVTVSGVNKMTITQAKEKEQPQFTGRQLSTLEGIKSGEALYVVAHGSKTHWGSADDKVGIDAVAMINFLAGKLQAGVNVYLCVCDSHELGATLKKTKSTLNVWAAKGTPKLKWNPLTRTITDSTGNFVQCN